VHTSDIPAMAQRDGYIGVRDFPGAVIRAYENEGWTFIGRAFVQKNPQSQAIRIKSKALLFVQLRKDSADSRPALIDQVLLFKKPGENEVPIMPVKNKELDNETWIEWAHGIWIGIRETETLQFGIARGADDEKHICPLQLGTIERCIKLYSNPGEMVLTPFGGIGSEAYMALKLGRKATLIELKQEYFNVAIENMKKAEASANVSDLFSLTGVEVA
jgi:DNA modification methylase